LASISSKEAADELLGYCLRGVQWPRELLLQLTKSPELFRVVAEGLADRFEPALCDTYASLFSEALSIVEPAFDAEMLVARYRQIRQPRKFSGPEPRNVFVLSRVTLGADVAITSVILNAAKQRFPNARIFLVGARKAWELFDADPRIEHLPVTYPRDGTLLERASALRGAVAQPDSITIDPDSRLTQLGLVPVCADDSYYFFESRSYGGDSDDSLGDLTKRWVAETFEIANCSAYIAPKGAEIGADVTVSLGVGENPAKRIADPFEIGLLRHLAQLPVLIDKGAGGEEAKRVEKAVAGVLNIRCWEGAFAPFAAAIAKSRLYVGYDSAGQHVAAACGVPLVSVFAGFPSPRMFARWRPAGEVVRVENPDPNEVLARTLQAIGKYGIIQT
jgi:hypothetical protein